ncbi:MAG: hypothetical protein P1U40_05645 [Coxiellaceae bacterium]|nr:hypothetical protein [Coxiellaceae bacterium]
MADENEPEDEGNTPSNEQPESEPEAFEGEGAGVDDSDGFNFDGLDLTDEQRAMLDEIAAVADQAGVDDPRLFLWDIKPLDILYLFDKFPFLQIVDTRVEVDPPTEPAFITADRSGWTIYDYGNAMSASPGLLLWGGGDFTIPEEGEKGGEIINPGKGTIVNQAYETAVEMIRIADERGWEGLLIVDGHPLMQWAAWVEAYDRGFVVEGFEPSEKDFAKRRLIRRNKEDEEQLRRKIQQTISAR